jgi:hypothetical protein
MSEKTVAAVMREQDLAARRERRGRGTTRLSWEGALARTGPGQAGFQAQKIKTKW